MPIFPTANVSNSAAGWLLIEPRELLAGPLRKRAFSAPLAHLLSQVLGIGGLNQLYSSVSHLPPGVPFYRGILESLNVGLEVDPQGLARIPATGALVAVANHPLGVLDGVALILLLAQARADARVMANYLMHRVPQLEQAVIPVDPFGGSAATQANRAGMREALGWLKQGGALGLFPAGEVAHWNPQERRVADPPWNPNVARLARRANATVLPIYFAGSNGLAFHLGGMLHPRLRTAQLARELLGRRDRCIEVRIGTPLVPKDLERWGSDAQCIQLLRDCTCLLGERHRSATAGGPYVRRWLPPAPQPPLLPRPVAKAGPAEEVAREVDSLPGDACLESMGAFTVYLAEAAACPRILVEIGRLRELTFRGAGEGSGKPLDLDVFDRHYQHLFVWNHASQQIVGAYRLVRVEECIAARGLRGSYLSTLFHFQPDFFRQLGPCIELGRSFVRPEYQRSPAALMLLWKGIAAVVCRYPECTRLIGPVSISNAYSHCSRQILVDFLTDHSSSHSLRELVRPRKPFPRRRLHAWRPESARMLVRELEDLSALIADMEADGKGIPVLLRHYLKLGGQILAFSVDTHFSNVLDGLIVVDLLRTDPKVLGRYMGKRQMARFLAFNGVWAGGTDPELFHV